jgi:hypothetical protein
VIAGPAIPLPRSELAPIPRALGLALAAAGPIAIGGILAMRGGALAPLAAVPAIVFGVAAATSPALYIAIAATGDAPPLAAVVRALAAAFAAFGVALAGLVLPATFLSLSSVAPGTTLVVCTCTLGGAAVLALRRLVGELQLRTAAAHGVFYVWAIATVGVGGRLWWDLAREAVS